VFDFAMVVINDDNGARNVIVPIETLPAPGDRVTLATGEIVTVQIVEHDPEQPEHVSLFSKLS
jgi:hypothetical protein